MGKQRQRSHLLACRGKKVRAFGRFSGKGELLHGIDATEFDGRRCQARERTQMNNQRFRTMLRCSLVLILLFGKSTFAQEKSDPAAQEKPSDAKSAGQNSEKAKPKAEEPEANTNAGAEALQKATQNPVASLISVPIQNNNNFGISPGDRTQDVLNIQPVIPVGISKNWNLIVRWIMPIVYQPLPNPPGSSQTGVYGFGDMVPTFFLSPKKPGKLIWGLGPVFQLPTATSTFLGQGKLGIGPSAVALMQPGHWTLGALVNNVWSVAGSGSRPPVNQFLLQYFINYNLKKGWFITWQPTLTANWEATNGGRWVVPFGGGLGRIMKLGAQPVSITAQFYGNGVHPPGTSSWTMRLQFALLFPKLSKEMEQMLLEKKLKQLQQEQPQKN